MAVRARLTVDGLKAATQRMDDVGDRARHPGPVLGSLGTLQDFAASERRQFASHRGWARLTPGWIAEKRRRGLDPRILVATGQLEKALTSGVRSSGITFRTYGPTVTFGITPGASDLHYAQALASGVGHRHTKRRAVVLDQEARARIAIRVELYVSHGVVTS